MIRLLQPHYVVLSNDSAFGALLRSFAEPFGFTRAITEFDRTIRQNSSWAAGGVTGI
jgi:hypothetical protein